MTTPTKQNPYRRLLTLSIATVCKEKGYDGVSKVALETMTEMLQAYLSELTRASRKFSEHGHRTTPDFTDLKMAFAEVGTSAHALNVYFKRERSRPLRDLLPAKAPTEHKTLKTGMEKVSQPSYIPSNFPEYPEVHAFVRTPALREPINQYELVRERVAAQKVATEESLVKFYAKTNPCETPLFDGINTDLYPGCNIDIEEYSYLNALKPSLSHVNTHDGESQNTDDSKTEQNDTTLDSSPQNTSNTSTQSNTDNPYSRTPKRMRRK